MRRPAYCDRYELLEDEDDLRFGTFAPARRASDRPIAIACLRLVTFLPERPLRKVPRLRSRIVFSTLLWAFLPYLAMMVSLAITQRRLSAAR
jgi:hypothetical protein